MFSESSISPLTRQRVTPDARDRIRSLPLDALFREFGLDVRGKSYRCFLSGHEDKSPSASIFVADDGSQRWHCHRCQRGGDACDFLIETGRAADFQAACELLASRAGVVLAHSPPVTRSKVAADSSAGQTTVYEYRHEDGSPAFQVRRHPEKHFSQWSLQDGTWTRGRGDAPYILYRLDRISLPENSERQILIVEGEKDVHTAEELGFLATTNAGGAGRWRAEYNAALAGRDLVVIGDNDDPGRRHVQDVSRGTVEAGCRVKVVTLPDVGKGGDLTDWVNAGGTATALQQIIDGTPEKKSPRAVSGDSARAKNVLPVLDPAALVGLAGDFVRTVGKESEADPAGLLVQTLVAAGNLLGARGYVGIGGSRQFARVNGILVGPTAKGRKGTSWNEVKALIRHTLVDDESMLDRVVSGLSSGEGLIWCVRDPIEKREAVRENGRVVDHKSVVADEGVSDKRKIILEPELASVLRVAERQGNTLSPVIRMAYDSGDLGQIVKNSPARATGAHISLIGHITEEELLRHLTATEMANGLANRFLWVFVTRRQIRPWGGATETAVVEALAKRLRRSVEWAIRQQEKNGGEPFEIGFTDNAVKTWEAVYEELSNGYPGLVGAVASRGEANVIRLANIYAQLDCSPNIRAEDLRAALAVWEYTVESISRIFGTALGDPAADRILDALAERPDGLSRTGISKLFGRHKNASQIDQALRTLLQLGRIRQEEEETGGRPKTIIHLVSPDA